jgi:drug/metabolite transporter (DMT)-like permease
MSYHYLLIAAAAALWGFIGIFVLKLQEIGFTPIEVVNIRAVTAGLILAVYACLKNPALLKIKAEDFKYFAGTGILSIVFFNWCYFTAMKMITLSLAVLLLYTAPIFVILISRVVFKEKITGGKIFALCTTLTGCFFISGILPGMDISISAAGFMAGIGSGLGYALYSIFAKLAGKKYSSITISTYTFIFAALFLTPLTGIIYKTDLLLQSESIIYSAGLGLIPTALAYVLYTKGLNGIEAGKAAVTANLEPLVAMMTGILFFGDILTGFQAAGAVCILGSVMIIQKS